MAEKPLSKKEQEELAALEAAAPLSASEEAELAQLEGSAPVPAQAQAPQAQPEGPPASYFEKVSKEAGLPYKPEHLKGIETGLLPGSAGLMGDLGPLGRRGMAALQGAATAESLQGKEGLHVPDPKNLGWGALAGYLGHEVLGEAVPAAWSGAKSIYRAFKPGSKETNAARMAELLKGRQVKVDPQALEGVPEVDSLRRRAYELAQNPELSPPPAPTQERPFYSGIGPKSPYDFTSQVSSRKMGPAPEAPIDLGSATPQGPSRTPLGGYEGAPAEPSINLGSAQPQGPMRTPLGGYEPVLEAPQGLGFKPPSGEGPMTMAAGPGPSYQPSKPITAVETNAARMQLDALVRNWNAANPGKPYPEAYRAAAHLRDVTQGSNPAAAREFADLSSALGANPKIQSLMENPLTALPKALGIGGVEAAKGIYRELFSRKPAVPWASQILNSGLFTEKKPPEE